MKLHYCGKYNLDPQSLPHGEHLPNAVKFREAGTEKQMALTANLLAMALLVVFGVPALLRSGTRIDDQGFMIGCIAAILSGLPHELLHALCFQKDVYLYTNFRNGMMFVTGTETMSKTRFIWMSLLPNIIFGVIPYVIGMLMPSLSAVLIFGTICLTMGAGDYYNVFNALTQMPRGSYTYMYQLSSYWYLPE